MRDRQRLPEFYTKAAWNPPLETASPCLVSLEAKTLHKETEWEI